MNSLIENIKLITIIVISVFVMPIVIMLFSGSRSSGLGLGILIGFCVGNLIYSILLPQTRMLTKFALWILTSGITLLIAYSVFNFLDIESEILIISLGFLLPVIISWEIGRYYLKRKAH